jgi:hypothetical protein
VKSVVRKRFNSHGPDVYSSLLATPQKRGVDVGMSVPGGIERTFPVAGMRFWKSVIPMLQLIG